MVVSAAAPVGTMRFQGRADEVRVVLAMTAVHDGLHVDLDPRLDAAIQVLSEAEAEAAAASASVPNWPAR